MLFAHVWSIVQFWVSAVDYDRDAAAPVNTDSDNDSDKDDTESKQQEQLAAEAPPVPTKEERIAAAKEKYLSRKRQKTAAWRVMCVHVLDVVDAVAAACWLNLSIMGGPLQSLLLPILCCLQPKYHPAGLWSVCLFSLLQHTVGRLMSLLIQ